MNNHADVNDTPFETAQSNLAPVGSERHGHAVPEPADSDRAAAVAKLIAAIEADEDLKGVESAPQPSMSGHTGPDRPFPATGPPPIPPVTTGGEHGSPKGAETSPMPPREAPIPVPVRMPGVPDRVPNEAVPLKEAANGHAGQRREGANKDVGAGQSSDPRCHPPEIAGGASAQRMTPPPVEVKEPTEKHDSKQASNEKADVALRDDHRSSTGHTGGSDAPKANDSPAPHPPAQNDVVPDKAKSATPENSKTGSRRSTEPQKSKEDANKERKPPPAVDTAHSSPKVGGKDAAVKPPLNQKPSQKLALCSRSTVVTAAFVMALSLALLTVIVGVMEYIQHRDRPVVRGRFGAVRGQRLVVSDGGKERTVHAFLGVPFAKAPRGPLRFKPPQPLDSPIGEDEEKPLESNVKRPPCPQQDFYLGHENVIMSKASEDCLHLNIWAPPWNCTTGRELGPCEKRAVLFFLYGAAFQNGGNSFEVCAVKRICSSSSKSSPPPPCPRTLQDKRLYYTPPIGPLYDGRYLSALGDMVVVVPNYRVGALGFLSGPWENRIPGNAGLQDQRLAFEWTLANIGSFGGDTSMLVLAGHDAGAASLGYHLFSGDTAFWTRNATRFILQSGGPYHRYEGEGVEGARRLAESLHCPSDLSTDNAVACLQIADVNSVARNPLALSFAPVFNRAPLSLPEARSAQGRSLVKRGHIEGCEFLLGRAASEGVYQWFVAQHRSASGDVHRLAARLLGSEMLERWQTATGVTLDADSPVAVYQKAVGDVLEACPMSELAEQLQAWQNRVYVYVLGYRPSYSSWTAETEAVHFEDMELVFGKPFRPKVSSSDHDRQWSRTMIDIWATFARTGRAPQVQDAKWSLYDSARPTLMKLGPKDVGEQSDDKPQQCVIIRSTHGRPQSVTTSPSLNGTSTSTAHQVRATRASLTLCGCVAAVVALKCASGAFRARLC
ncbi:hypothetical protein HPB50_000547 [Hyalomma asiaticum]|uniref:Uncharacterized protein n=1 Tax=Hyalomma asiaticum TaxID=266040 RepID=A0ACB7T2R1_HYAAI|nr:hypothetical protein HPB50_000547 [Hyalomma asiaticum]